MAFDEELYQQRRQERKRRQEAKKKKLIIKLVLAAFVLVLCAVLIAVFVNPGKEETPQPGVTTATPGKEESKPEATTADPEQFSTIHIAAVGDLNVTQKLVDAGGMERDYTETFLDIAHLLGDADISVVNFEGVLCGEPYGESKSAPLSLMQNLSSAGVDLVQIANSYSIYKGVSGLAKTVENVRAAGMEPLGAYDSNAAREESGGYLICEANGVKIAFVAFTKGMDGMALPAGSEKCVNVLYEDYASTYKQVATQAILDVVNGAKAEEPDMIIAMVHWGSEFNDTLSNSQLEIETLLHENGVDAIIGTHSHYVQQMKLKDGKFTAYSLGDFAGDADRSGSEYSVVLDLEITKNHKTGKTNIVGFSYTPIFTVVEEEKPIRVMRIKEAMAAFEGGYIDSVAKETYDKMAYALERIENRINPKK
ncbi:MAG: CapA family protein [Oscillospiraceae bacterium]|nr:CapA family protein [Oscillospiraceae bacterium]